MKKNKMMRLASVLLVLVMLTTCVISGTFAKYVQQGSASDEARVAKWGITIDTRGNDAFASSYENDATPALTTVANTNVAENLVAPGTAGELGYAKIAGTPEVAFDVAVTCDLDLANWYSEGANEYCPLVFTVGTEKYYIGKDGIATVANLEIAVENAVIRALLNLADASSIAPTDVHAPEYANATDGRYAIKQFAPNADSAGEVIISWAWNFELDAALTNHVQTNELDTKLGDVAATGTAPTVSFILALSATQQD